ncbi:MAG: helix-turn-helix transcriptional regulator [Rubrivivax sp.]|nr:helix-turn-helix transcriptional regulator [Rubrivivax sp.]
MTDVQSTRVEPAPAAPPAAADRAWLGQWLVALLDRIGCSLVVLDGQARVRYLNRTALQQLGGEHPLLLAGQTLVPRHESDQAAWRAGLMAAGQGQRRWVTLGTVAQPVDVSVVPLRGAGTAATLLVIGAPRSALPAAAQDLARCVGLTPAEGRVLALLCAGVRPAEIARCQGVAVSTVRTQISSARHKTGAASIRELVRQVAVLPPL